MKDEYEKQKENLQYVISKQKELEDAITSAPLISPPMSPPTSPSITTRANPQQSLTRADSVEVEVPVFPSHDSYVEQTEEKKPFMIIGRPVAVSRAWSGEKSLSRNNSYGNTEKRPSRVYISLNFNF